MFESSPFIGSHYLGQVTDKEKATGKHIRIVRMRIAAYTARLLFYELTIAVNDRT